MSGKRRQENSLFRDNFILNQLLNEFPSLNKQAKKNSYLEDKFCDFKFSQIKQLSKRCLCFRATFGIF